MLEESIDPINPVVEEEEELIGEAVLFDDMRNC